MRGSHYLKRFGTLAIGLLLAVAAVNLIVDPYAVTQFVRLGHFNAKKPKEWENARLHKPFDLLRRHYDGIVIGTSQVERGFDPADEELVRRNIAIYNLGLSEIRLYETALLLDFAARKSGITFAVIVLDFMRYNRPPENPEASLPRDWNERRLFEDYGRTLISYRSLADSGDTVYTNLRGLPSLEHLANGELNLPQFFAAIGLPDYRMSFDAVDSVYLNDAYYSLVAARQSLLRTGFDHAELRRILAIARSDGIALHFVIPPVHAREMEVIEYLGLMPLMDEWKAELVCELAHEGVGKSAFPLWDFSGYSEVAAESVPAKDDKSHLMTWFYDPIHFTPLAGAAILDRVLGLNDPRFAALTDFGTRITPANLAQHLEELRARRQSYLAGNPSFARDIAALYKGRPLPAPPAEPGLSCTQ